MSWLDIWLVIEMHELLVSDIRLGDMSEMPVVTSGPRCHTQLDTGLVTRSDGEDSRP